MKYAVYEWLSKYIKNNKKLVQYLYVLYALFYKYQNNIYSYVDQIRIVNWQLWDILSFFKEKKYNKKDVYTLLQDSIKKTWYNIYTINKSWKIGNIKIDWDVIENNIDNDIWIYIKSADNKIYKRFLLDDIKKSLWI